MEPNASPLSHIRLPAIAYAAACYGISARAWKPTETGYDISARAWKPTETDYDISAAGYGISAGAWKPTRAAYDISAPRGVPYAPVCAPRSGWLG